MKLHGMENLIRKLENLREATTGKGLRTSGKKTARQGRNSVRERAPKRTGKYSRSVRDRREEEHRAHVKHIIYTDSNLGLIHEFGTGLYGTAPGATPHLIPIASRTGGLLAFKWPGAPAGLAPRAGGVFFFHRVMHPGVRPQPHFRPAIDEDKDKIVGVFIESQREEIREAIK